MIGRFTPIRPTRSPDSIFIDIFESIGSPTYLLLIPFNCINMYYTPSSLNFLLDLFHQLKFLKHLYLKFHFFKMQKGAT